MGHEPRLITMFLGRLLRLQGTNVRAMFAPLAVALLVACGTLPDRADPASDAPEARTASASPIKVAASYHEALTLWKNADDVNAWIGAKFQYDMARAMKLSETQRHHGGRLPVYHPEAFFAAPSGVCVDLARFGVETLRAMDRESSPVYVMIEFDPISIAGNTLRRHWIASFQRDGKHYYFADSKRPGHIAGPYASTQEFITEYARYRGREIVQFREMASFERQSRTMSARQRRD
jgi:hypothetical protein